MVTSTATVTVTAATGHVTSSATVTVTAPASSGPTVTSSATVTVTPPAGAGTVYGLYHLTTGYQLTPASLYHRTAAGQVPVYITAGNTPITPTDPTAAPPVASFTGTPLTGTDSLAVQFTSTSTGTGPLTYAWTFGDGTTSSVANPFHLYGPGTYTVALTVSNTAGTNTQTRAAYLTVAATPVAAPVAVFTGTPLTGARPLAVQFTSTSSGTSPSHAWTFGDGATSTAVNPTHTYAAAGTYTVALTVSNTAGSNTQTRTNYVTAAAATTPTINTGQTGAGGAWTLQFEDDFPGTSLDTTKWSPVAWNQTINGVTPLASNVTVADSICTLRLSDLTHGAAIASSSYNGDPALANGWKLPVGGCVEFRVWFDASSTGSLPNWGAVWTSAVDWPGSGEIDIAEVLDTVDSSGGRLTANYHRDNGTGSDTPSAIYQSALSAPSAWGNGWHTFTAVRGQSTIYIYWDGVLRGSIARDEVGSTAHPLVANLGVHSARNDITKTLKIDWVRGWVPA